MANTSRPNGFRFVGMADGASPNGAINMYLCPSADGTAIFVGDAVKSGGTAGAAGVFVNGQDMEGIPTIAQAAATDVLRGVVVGFLPLQSDLTVLHRVASTNRVALVCDAPNALFEAQEDGLGAALVAADIGENVDLIVNAGSTVTGQSGMLLDSSTHATTSAQFRIMGLLKRVDNVLGTGLAGSSFAKFLVMINKHELKSTTGV